MSENAMQYAQAASASAYQAQASATDPAVRKLAEAVQYLGFAISELAAQDT